jgi:hypothetical protein
VNLASATAELNIYHWASPTAIPEKFTIIPSTVTGSTAGRFGDDMSMNLDENGNGFIYLGNSLSAPSSADVLRIKVTGFNNYSELTLFTAGASTGMWRNYNLVVGTTDEYAYTGPSGTVALVGNSGNPIYIMDNNENIFTRASDAHITTYNQKRYLGLTTGHTGAAENNNSIYIYDITKGETTKEALELFDSGSKSVLSPFPRVLKGAGNSSVYCASFAFAEASDALYIFGAAPYGAGFVVLEAPKATDRDNFYDEE